MKVLITGGAGFIGSHLAEAYLMQGEDVYIIDDLSTGSLENIKHLEKQDDSSDRLFVTVDSVLNREKMVELVGICDVVLHMAAAVGVDYILNNPLSSIMTNVRGTEIVLELCNKFRKKVLVASTSEVYGKHTHAPLIETDNCIYGPSSKFRWSYAASKLIDEFTALGYHRTKRLDVTVVRLFNTVGPRQSGEYGMVLPRFIQHAIRNEPLLVYGDGAQTRTFTHVHDVVRCMTKLIECKLAFGEVVNIGGTEEVTILDLAKRVIRQSKSSSTIKFIPYEEAYPKDFEDMRRRVPSLEKLKKLIDDSPEMELDRIIEDIISSLKSSPSI